MVGAYLSHDRVDSDYFISFDNPYSMLINGCVSNGMFQDRLYSMYRGRHTSENEVLRINSYHITIMIHYHIISDLHTVVGSVKDLGYSFEMQGLNASAKRQFCERSMMYTIYIRISFLQNWRCIE